MRTDTRPDRKFPAAQIPAQRPGLQLVRNVLEAPGRPLDSATRAGMESRFGHDFSRVRVHTDLQAAQSARAVNALAYTVGQDVVFGQGQYVPESAHGIKLLAHELTHTLQQGRQTSARSAALQIGPPAGPA